MAHRRRRFALILVASAAVALGLPGFRAKRRSGGPLTVSFEPAPAPPLASQPLLAVDPAGLEALLVGIDRRATGVTSYASADMGRTWSLPSNAPSSFPEGSLSDYDGELLRTASKAVVVVSFSGFEEQLRSAGRVELLRAASSRDGGATWQPEGLTEVRRLQGVASVGAMDVGRSTVAVVGASRDLVYPLYVSLDEGATWTRRELSLPRPDGYERITVTPPSVYHGPDLVVDGRERIHLLFSEYTLTDTDGKRQRGTFYLRADDGAVFDLARLTPAHFRSQKAALGENRARPDVLYRVTSSEEASPERDRSKVKYQLEVSISENGGEEWSPPFLLDGHEGIKQFLRVEGDGDLVVVAWRDDRTDGPGLYVSCSVDGGATWSAAERVGETPASRRYQLAVSGARVLLVGTVEGPSSFQSRGTFVVTGSTKGVR